MRIQYIEAPCPGNDSPAGSILVLFKLEIAPLQGNNRHQRCVHLAYFPANDQARRVIARLKSAWKGRRLFRQDASSSRKYVSKVELKPSLCGYPDDRYFYCPFWQSELCFVSVILVTLVP
uniref:Uncharacterized protein n=1 Tax=Cyclophora tenuis TaxID=216820 RepID=A0A7S1GIM6_CYCTE|mmetsp:Transcript_18097/g.30855  ORF Transcript_18097/g.30855 Transcript_18097/m.30855 type:complete len:120 (+) Transcript_18097:2-361(+)